MLSSYSFSGSGLSFDKSGNKLTITASKAPTDAVTVTANKGSKRKGVITWSDGVFGHKTGQLQDIVTWGEEVSDPVKAYINVKVSYGSAKIVKTSEDGVVNNIKFHIKGGNIDKDVTTNSKGEIQVDNLIPGKYTVTEYAMDRYEPQSSKTVTVQAGQTATVSFGNVLKKGDLQITKTSEDGLVEGIKFHLTGTSLSGAKINEYATTNASGVAKQGNILEPSCGIGNFIGMLPDSMKDSKMYGIELDSISAQIAQQLYQKSSVLASPFEEAKAIVRLGLQMFIRLRLATEVTQLQQLLQAECGQYQKIGHRYRSALLFMVIQAANTVMLVSISVTVWLLTISAALKSKHLNTGFSITKAYVGVGKTERIYPVIQNTTVSAD